MSSSATGTWVAGIRKVLGCILAVLVVAAALALLLFLPAYLSVQDATCRSAVRERLGRLAGAMHAYHDKHHHLPPRAIFDKEGSPLLSWRVLLLPYLGQGDLFSRFKLDEPWDSPHNKQLLIKRPDVYKHPRQSDSAEPSGTHFQVFVGPGAAFEGKRGLHISRDFPDGPSFTILIAEGAQAVPWTKPEDLPYAPDRPLPKLGGLFGDRSFFIALADGSAHELLQETSAATLRALITRNGDDKPGPDW